MEYRVDSLHINVEHGDCALHLLVSMGLNSRKIVRAVLIDGGKGSKNNMQALHDTLLFASASSRYTDHSIIQLDAIIVTHWDTDHYLGIVQVFKDDYDTCQLTGENFPRIIKKASNGNPTTNFFCPNWNATPILDGSGVQKAHGTAFGTSTDGIYVTLTFNKVAYPIGILCCGNILGAEIFSGQPLKAGTVPVDIGSPAGFAGAFANAVPNPRMYCVAAWGEYLGPNQMESSPNIKMEKDDDNPGIVGSAEKPTKTNGSSIACMIMWESGQMSHYFGGDLGEKLEGNVVNWTQASAKSGLNVQPQSFNFVTSIKLSHHGSHTSTPANMLDSFSPENIIVSPSADYGHPRFELLLYIWLWNEIRKLNRSTTPNEFRLLETPLWTTIYPYWFAQRKVQINPYQDQFQFVIPAEKKVSVQYLDNPTYLKFQQALQVLETNLRSLLNDTGFDLFSEWNSRQNRDQKLAYIAGILVTAWPKISLITSAAYPARSASAAVGTYYGTASTQTTRRAESITFILVESRQHYNQDGSVWIKTQGHDLILVKDNSNRPPPQPHLQSKQQPVRPKWMKLAPNLVTFPYPCLTTNLPNEPCVLMTDTNFCEDGNDADEMSEFVPPSTSPSLSPTTRLIGSVNQNHHPTMSLMGVSLPSGYYLVSPRVTDLPSDVTTQAISDATFSGFVSTLNTGFIGLDSAPNTTPVSLLDDDEWFLWWTGAKTMAFDTLKATGTADTISAFTTTMSVAGTQLTFDTESIVLAFPALPQGQTIEPVLDNDTIVLGLNPASLSFQTTLGELCTWVSITVPILFNPIALTLQSVKGLRNAVWFTPGLNYKTTVRLTFDVNDASDQISTYMQEILGDHFALQKSFVILRKEGCAALGGGIVEAWTSSITFGISLLVTTSNAPITIEGIFTVDSNNQTTIIIQEAKNSLLDYITLLTTLCGETVPSPDTWVDSIAKDLIPRRLRIVYSAPTPKNISYFTLDLEAKITVGNQDQSTVQAVLFTLSWDPDNKFSLAGSMWTTPSDPWLQMACFVASYEEYNNLQPSPGAAPTTVLHLASLIPNCVVDNIPAALDGKVYLASFSVSDSQISFYGALTSDMTQQTAPCAQLGLLSLGATYSTSGSVKTTELSLDIVTTLSGNSTAQYIDGPGPMPAVLHGQLTYVHSSSDSEDSNSSWTISASMQDLNLATLYDFFHSDSQDCMVAMLGGVNINSLDLTYILASGADSFTITADICFCQVIDLNLTYIYPTSHDWTFLATMTAMSDTSTLKDLTLQHLVAEFSTVILPDYIGTISLAGDSFAMTVNASKATLIPQGLTTFTVIEVSIGGFNVVFAQCGRKGSPSKSLFCTAVTKLPDMTGVPVVNKLTQPFDEMYFMYVSQDEGGLAQSEVEQVNSMLTGSVSLVYKQTAENPNPSAAVLASGFHFAIVMNVGGTPTCILDYVFGSSSSSMEIQTLRDSTQSTAAMAPMQQSFGPVSISSIGLQMNNDVLGILFDASVKLGPVELEMIGFMIGVDLANGTLANLPPPQVAISGLGVSYNSPPTTIAGLFVDFTFNGEKVYAGGVQVSFAPYEFLAEGCYGTIPNSDDPFKTVAVFGRLDGPLIELEFAQISAICGGFGYNSALTLPTVDNVSTHPFIGTNTVPKPDDNPLIAFSDWIPNRGSGWVVPTLGSSWFAVGLTVLAFQTLKVNAVVIVNTEPKVTLGIFGECVAQFPPQSEDGKQVFVYVELGIVSSIDYNAGTMLVLGKLSPRSFIFDQNCHLTGSFGMGYWFGPSANAGDWVFTVGGYNPGFTVPSHYPAADRLQISWIIDSTLSIIGQAYIAITPKACMAGGSLSISLILGKLSAAFSCWADFLLNYQPFFFTADAGVTVSVQYTLDLWITTLHIDIEIGATVNLAGPPTHGSAHVDFWVFGFTVSFGQSSAPPDPLSLSNFYNNILLQAPTGPNGPHTLTCIGGLVPPATRSSGQVSPGTPWLVRGGNFCFSLKSPFAFSSVTISGGSSVEGPDGIYSRPMRLVAGEELDSTITVTITAPVSPTSSLTAGTTWSITGAPAQVPTAVWGLYSADQDPIMSGNQITDLLDPSNPTIPLLMSVEISAPSPKFAPDLIPAFDATSAFLDTLGTYPQGPLPADSSAWIGSSNSSQQQQLIDVKNAWLAPENAPDAATKVAAEWINYLQWDKTNSDGFSLNGAPPVSLLESYEQSCLAAPLLTTS